MAKPVFYPLFAVSASTATYASIFYILSRGFSSGKADLRSINKAISASHATLTTILAVYALRPGHWHIEALSPRDESQMEATFPDDSKNMIIAGR